MYQKSQMENILKNLERRNDNNLTYLGKDEIITIRKNKLIGYQIGTLIIQDPDTIYNHKEENFKNLNYDKIKDSIKSIIKVNEKYYPIINQINEKNKLIKNYYNKISNLEKENKTAEMKLLISEFKSIPDSKYDTEKMNKLLIEMNEIGLQEIKKYDPDSRRIEKVTKQIQEAFRLSKDKDKKNKI